MTQMISDSTGRLSSAIPECAGPKSGRHGSLFSTAMVLVCLALSPPASAHAAASALAGALAPSFSVQGAPVVAHSHPDTLFDSQEIAAYKAALAKDPALRAAFDALQTWGDKRIAEPLNVPAHLIGKDGSWSYPGYKRGYQDGSGKWVWEWNFNGALQNATEDVSNLGMLYALTGNGKYAAYAGQLLLALTDAYGYGKGSAIPDPHGYDHFAAYGFDGGDAGMFLARACNGFDLIYGSLSTQDRGRIEQALIRPMAEHLEKTTFMYTTHDRWGMVCLYGLFIAGETLNDRPMTELALFGQGGSVDNVTGGFMDCFKPAVLRDGVIWGAAASLPDQISAMSVLTAVAEVMWHRGVDLYSYKDAAIEKSYNAALKPLEAYKGADLRSIPGIDAYQYVFSRYRNRQYLKIIGQLEPDFSLAIGEHLPSLPTPEAHAK